MCIIAHLAVTFYNTTYVSTYVVATFKLAVIFSEFTEPTTVYMLIENETRVFLVLCVLLVVVRLLVYVTPAS
jgi:hypothetical protein